METPFVTHSELDKKNSETYIEVNKKLTEIENVTSSIGSENNGKTYDKATEAIAVNPKPSNGVRFFLRNNDSSYPEYRKGEYTWQSSETDGILFERDYPVQKTEIGEYINLYDENNIIEGYYLSNTVGNAVTNATSSISNYIPVKPDTFYHISGKTTTQKVVVCYDSNGNVLKPYHLDGIESSTFTTEYVNGAFLTPPTAVSFRFTLVLAGTGTTSGIQVSEGISKKKYREYNDYIIKSEKLPITVKTPLFRIENFAESCRVRTEFNENYDILVNFDFGYTDNKLININDAKLLEKGAGSNETGKPVAGFGSDDACPSRVNNWFVGGNHGYPSRIITANNHGKTLADVGAVYSGAGREYVILKIIDDNNIQITENLPSINNYVITNPPSILVYQSNGENVADINITSGASTLEQLYSFIKNTERIILIDNELKQDEGYFEADSFQIIEKYSITDFNSMVDSLITDRPSGGYLTQPNFTNGDVLIDVINVFEIQKKGKISLKNSWLTRKELLLNYWGITQNTYSPPSWSSEYNRYFPKTLPVTNDSNSYDFRLGVDMKTTTIVGQINFTTDQWENSNPTSRVYDALDDGTDLKVNFNMGYLPLGGDRSTMVNRAWWMSSSKKNYPQYGDDALGSSGVIPANTMLNGIVFRGWSEPTGIATNNFLIKSSDKYYLYLDYHQEGNDKVVLPEELQGKSITIADKSNNVTILNTIVVDEINIVIENASPMYGYAELIFE